ncbi:hypothetical protein LDENG_00187760 [Lucifuga dentata]|nr:hypothetical protein LDENG_00187760 [Lucifuga dentata]
MEAIKLMQCRKSPGPDRYPVEFYKKFITKIAPLPLRVFTDSALMRSLSFTLGQASISLILKKDRNPKNCSSYHPISLLFVDIKILAKGLAKRLETVLPNIISEDQTGFMQNHHSYTSIRHLLRIIRNHLLLLRQR